MSSKEAQLLKSHNENLARALSTSEALRVLYEENYESEKEAHEETKKFLMASRKENEEKDAYIAELQKTIDELKRSQVINQIFNNSTYQDNSKTIILNKCGDTPPALNEAQ